ncbi:MAG: hypothetical protein IJM43_10375, partial [Bacteroidaceae bacterium]|nr:hypothetical protein [Bacteroidaceae bacterium]
FHCSTAPDKRKADTKVVNFPHILQILGGKFFKEISRPRDSPATRIPSGKAGAKVRQFFQTAKLFQLFFSTIYYTP